MAAAIHLGRVTRPDRLSVREVLALPYFDMQDDEEVGSMRLVGRDDGGNAVYILGRDSHARLTEKLFSSCARELGIDQRSFVMTDALPYVNVLMIIGGYLSRRLRVVRFGRLIAATGTKLAAPALGVAVRETRQKMAALARMPVLKTNGHHARVFIYHSNGGPNVAAIAGLVHIGELPTGGPPDTGALRRARVLERVYEHQPGDVHPVGEARDGSLVLSVALGMANELLPRALGAFLEISGIDPKRVVMQDTSCLANTSIALAGVARRLGAVHQSEALVMKAMSTYYPRLPDLVGRSIDRACKLDPNTSSDG